MSGSHLFNLGFYQKHFLSTSRVSGPAINMGCTRGRGSTTRMFNYCKQHSQTPSLCINEFITIPPPPTTPKAPTITSVEANEPYGYNCYVIQFTAPENDGGSPITDYVYSVDGGLTFTSIGLPPTDPLSAVIYSYNGSSNIIIAAVNSVGRGANSNSVTVNGILGWTALPAIDDNLLNGLNGTIYCSVKDTNGNIYFAGDNVYINGSGNTNNCIAIWITVNQTWTYIDFPIINGYIVFAMAIDSNNNIYIGGNFINFDVQQYNYIAKFNSFTTSWENLDDGTSPGVDNIVYAIEIDANDDVYVGGDFVNAGGSVTNINHIAKWNAAGLTWNSLAGTTSNGVSSTVYAIAIDSTGNVYVGGLFSNADSTILVKNIAYWNKNAETWNALGSNPNQGTNGKVSTIAIQPSTNNIYVGGEFTNSGGITVYFISRWDGSSWHSLNPDSYAGLNYYVNSLQFSSINSNILYIGGLFTQNNDTGSTSAHIVKWDIGSPSWNTIGYNGIGDPLDLNTTAVNTIVETNGNIYVGGTFGYFELDGSGSQLSTSNVAFYVFP